MDKKVIIEKIIPKLEVRLTNLKESIEKAEQFAIQSPSAMQSWSDTSRFQLRSVAANLKSQRQHIEKCLQELKEIDTSKKYQKVELGALVKIKMDNRISNYFISPAGSGGEILSINKEQIRTLSLDSALAKKLLGKKSGDKIKLEGLKIPQDITVLEMF